MHCSETLQEVYTTNCVVEICHGGDEKAESIAEMYDNCGDPLDDCSELSQGTFLTECYETIKNDCPLDLSNESLAACVKDACALKHGGHDPLPGIEQVCPPDITDVCDDLGDPPPDFCTTTTTTIDMSDPNPTCEGGLPMVWIQKLPEGWPDCGIPVTEEQCDWWAHTVNKEMYSHPDGSLMESYKPRFFTDLPHGCQKREKHADDDKASQVIKVEESVYWNVLDFLTAQQGADRGDHKGHICCGNSIVFKDPAPTTTTMSTTGITIDLPDPDDGNDPPPDVTGPDFDGVVDRPPGATWGECKLVGDPHINGFDYKKAYDFYGHGTFWIVKSSSVWIQGFYADVGVRPAFTYLRKLAIGGPFLNWNTLMLETSNIWWNDQEHIVPLDHTAISTWTGLDGAVEVSSRLKTGTKWYENPVSIDLHHDVKIRAVIKGRLDGAFLPHLDAIVIMRQITGQDGHCGTFNGDPSDDRAALLNQRFGKPVDESEKLIPYG
jgi:hypothetical protein